MHHQFAVMRVPHGWLLRQTMPIQYSSFLHHKPQLFNFVVHGAPHARLSLFFLTPSLPRSLALSLSLWSTFILLPFLLLARSLARSLVPRRGVVAASLAPWKCLDAGLPFLGWPRFPLPLTNERTVPAGVRATFRSCTSCIRAVRRRRRASLRPA